ncbi:EF-P 5-aminopentanol modification-associated protein YfmF [Marinilactibacillus piezotolerans]|uniref:EF-P 5-aminopentanol modification-associated protein YfmF n=1 Tax=Marinilactibacillus piezotolerans TaxID=258723 RepID=UPI0009AF955F|nr:pitrilysin family protein [Marinilactibacillus piezotolerans]
MQVRLAEGVTLNIIRTDKFKTTTIKFKFKSLLRTKDVTPRTLISNLLNTNSLHYPTQTDFRKVLSDLYGASLSTDVSKKGNVHILSLDMRVVNEQFVEEKDLLEKALLFLQNILFYPNVYGKAFHRETTVREIENLRDEYEAIYDDKQDYASLKLNELTFDSEAQKLPSFGRESDLQKITAEGVYEVYQQMLSKDEIEIFVLGEVEEEKIRKVFEKFEFNDRALKTTELFYRHPENNNVKEQTEKQRITQTKLNLSFVTDIYYRQASYLPGLIVNGLFGGYAHSKLFVNIREKASLAYSISSGLDTFTGTMFVEAGIEESRADEVERMILKELEDIRQGKFSDDALNQTKALLKNDFYQSEDSASSQIERRYVSKLAGLPELELEKWIADIDAVTKEEVAATANHIFYKAKFLLAGKG